MNLRDAKTLMRASLILNKFASQKSKYSEQWLDDLGDGLEEVAKAMDPQVKSLTDEGDE